jgi:hypothetical protein
MRTSVTRIALLAAAVLLAAIASSAAAQGKKGNKKARNAVKAQDHTLVHELHRIKHTMSVANHNYNGHRVKAMHEIGHAVHELKKEAHLRGHKGAMKPPTGPEPQPISDAQMAKSAEALKDVLTQLESLATTPRRTKAANHINAAVKQVGLALEFRKQKEQQNAVKK